MKTNRFAATLLALAVVAGPAAASITLLPYGDADAHAPEKAKAKEKERERARERDAERSAERIEREEELYDDATDALDENDWRRASAKFRMVANLGLEHAPASLFWLAYAQNKMGQRSEALATLVELRDRYAKSKWSEDAKALEVEIRQAAGQHIEPENVEDDELKLMAVMGVMNSDPARGVALVEKLLASPTTSSQTRDRALFVLSQSDHPKALEILARVARDNSNPSLQSKAVKYLGTAGGEKSRKALTEIYASATDTRVKKQVLRAFMVANDRAHLLNVARTDPRPDLREEAVTQLGVLGARNELSDLYANESSVQIRKKIIQAMFIGGNTDKLIELAQRERLPELRITAIRNLGLLGGTRSAQALLAIYDSDANPEVRRAVIKALFLQQNATALITLHRREKDPELRKEIVSKLSLIQSKEAADFLMDYLKE